jgi:hypothetical protein
MGLMKWGWCFLWVGFETVFLSDAAFGIVILKSGGVGVEAERWGRGLVEVYSPMVAWSASGSRQRQCIGKIKSPLTHRIAWSAQSGEIAREHRGMKVIDWLE